MEEIKKIRLKTGTVSLSQNLGTYFIDMRPAIIHYDNNIWGGIYDNNGVPMCRDSKGNLFYSPVNVLQYGLILHAMFDENQNSKTLQTLKQCIHVLDQIKSEKDDHCVWYYHQMEERYHIHPPWASAMAQGEAISLYLRMYQLEKNEAYIETAVKSYNYLKLDYSNGGVRRLDQDGNLWFEEYPSEKPSFVLNGFIYTIFGLYDLFRVTQDTGVKSDIEACIDTLKMNLHKYDVGYWSVYDLLKRELVHYYYQKNVHVLQLEILAELTGEPIFMKYKNKWEKTLNPMNYLFVQFMYRLQPRIQRLRALKK